MNLARHLITYAKETGQLTLSAGSYVVLKYASLRFSRKCVSSRSGGKWRWQSCCVVDVTPFSTVNK